MEESMKNVLHWMNLWRMGVLWMIVLLICHVKMLLTREHVVSLQPPIMANVFSRACIITGASSGIGKATAERLALKGYYVILAGRSMVRLRKVAEDLHLRHKCLAVKAMELDLASTKSIIKFTKSIEQLLEAGHGSMSLQLLINNAGILAATPRTTPEGYDWMIATNYLGHYLLTHVLVPLLRRSSVPARIVNVGSFTHRTVQSFDGLLMLLQKREMGEAAKPNLGGFVYQMAYIYETSKLFMIMFAYELHRWLNDRSSGSRVTVTVADPGLVCTDIFREFPCWFSAALWRCLTITACLQPPSKGCEAVVDAAMAPPECSGKYFFGGQGRTLRSSFLSYEEEFAADLWAESHRLCSEDAAQHDILV